MSGATSASIVGVKRCSSPCVSSSACESGNAISFTNASASSPITTTRRGCTMRSSRRSQARDVSMSAPANLTQFVPKTSLASTCSRSSDRFSACPERP